MCWVVFQHLTSCKKEKLPLEALPNKDCCQHEWNLSPAFTVHKDRVIVPLVSECPHRILDISFLSFQFVWKPNFPSVDMWVVPEVIGVHVPMPVHTLIC